MIFYWHVHGMRGMDFVEGGGDEGHGLCGR